MEIPLAAFAIPLSEVRGAWLELTCCRGITFVPLGIVQRGGEVRTLGGLLTRLRCRHCRMSPRTVALVSRADQAAAVQTGAWAGWRVPLVQ